MNTSLIAMYFLTSIVLIITPGPDMIFVLTNGITHGKKAGLLSALGVSFGLVIHSCFAALGLGVIINQSLKLFTIIKFLGAIYLVYLGLNSWLNKRINLVQENNIKHKKIFFNGVISNITNPKIVIFFLAFLPQFVQQNIGFVQVQLLILGIIFSSMTVIILIFIGITSSKLGNKLQENKFINKQLKKITGSIYILLGLRLALVKNE